MDWFVNGLITSSLRRSLAEGVRAAVSLYYDDYTDATELDPQFLDGLQVLQPYLDDDLEDLIRGHEEALSREGGRVLSTFPETA